jgi:hypothetical protein
MFFIKKADGIRLRPISLASCLCKLLERMVNNRLPWWLENHQKLLGSQFGFHKAKPCTNNLSILYGEIMNDFIKDKGTTAAFLDGKAAMLTYSRMDEKLKKKKRSSSATTSLGLEPGLQKKCFTSNMLP